jgi:hypothetical protein
MLERKTSLNPQEALLTFFDEFAARELYSRSGRGEKRKPLSKTCTRKEVSMSCIGHL